MVKWLATVLVTAIVAALFFSFSPGRRAVALGATSQAVAASQPAALKISVAIPEGPVALDGGAMHPLKQNDFAHLHVVFENVSNGPLALFDEWNSWGFNNLSLSYTLPNGATVLMKKGAKNTLQIWSTNFPSFTTLEPGQMLVRDVWLDPKTWSNVPTITETRYHNEKPMVLMVKAIFTEENNESDDKENPGISTVWNGSIESAPVKIVLFTHP